MKEKIERYFRSWIDQDCSMLQELFDENIRYSECYGPEYFGLTQVLTWFQDWQKHGRVHTWEIKQIIEQNNTYAVEWYFNCEYDNAVSEFNGVSLIEFNEVHKMISVKEFESKKEHNYPYGKC